MTKGQKIGALVLAAVVAVVAIVALRPPGQEADGPSTQTTTQPGGSGEGAKQTERPAKAAPQYATIRVRDGEPVGGPKRISLGSGELARIEVRSDRAGEIHIHGYDKYLDVEAGKPARTRFRANLEGVFEIEDHDTATQLAELRVAP